MNSRTDDDEDTEKNKIHDVLPWASVYFTISLAMGWLATYLARITSRAKVSLHPERKSCLLNTS